MADDVRVRLDAIIDGGGHERGMRSGTLAVQQIVGLGTACELCREELPTEAARLCARAEAGQILTMALVQNLAAARSAATFRPFGAFELKGLPGPVPLFEVPWPIVRAAPGPSSR